MQKKYKLLSLVLIVAFASSAVFASSPAIASWLDNSVVSVTSSVATTGITTTVQGVATNAVLNPIDINGHYYTVPGGVGPYAITDFNSGPIASGPSTTSVASVSASGFVPGDYALFQVTITNTGPTTLQFSTYSVLSEFVDSSGTSIPYTFPLVTDLTQPVGSQNMGGNTAPANPAPAYNAAITGFWDTAATQSAMTTTFQTYINNEAIAGCANTWCGDNALIGSTAPTVGQTLVHGATFVYYIYIGLGIDTAPGIPAALYTVTIPLTVAN